MVEIFLYHSKAKVFPSSDFQGDILDPHSSPYGYSCIVSSGKNISIAISETTL